MIELQFLFFFIDYSLSISNLLVTFVDDMTITLNWENHASFESRRSEIIIEIDIFSMNDKIKTVTIGSTQTSATILSLQSLTNYSFSVYVVTSAGRSMPSNISAMTLSTSKINMIS